MVYFRKTNVLHMQTDAQLVQLWKRRDDLTADEWGELYQLILVILKRSNPSILRSLPDTKESYIQGFFLCNVFESAKCNTSSPTGGNALCSYFNKYLIDVYRSAEQRTTDYVEDYDEVKGACINDQANEMPTDSEFFEYGLSYQEVHQHAIDMLAQLDDTGRIYLALHACADTPEPLQKLAERFKIQSYHHRALKLGITRKKGEFGDGYESTIIGRWLAKDLGLELTVNPAVHAALKILCRESLQQYQHKLGLR